MANEIQPIALMDLPESTDPAGKYTLASSEGGDYKMPLSSLEGQDGVSPSVSVATISGGHRITITDKTGTQTVDVMDGVSDGLRAVDAAESIGKIANRYINTSGALTTSTNFDTYLMSRGKARVVNFKVGGNNNESSLSIAFYRSSIDATGFISGLSLPAGTVEQSATVPAGTEYIALVTRRSVLAKPEILLSENFILPSLSASEVTERGNMSISATGWSWSESNTRASTIYGCSLHLYPGDIIKGNSSIIMYVGGRQLDGTYFTWGWGSEYPVTVEGDYVFICKYASSEVAPSGGDYSLITDNIRIYSANAGAILAEFRALNSPLNDWDKNVRGINHRGFNTMAPENTLPAFRLSKANGFGWIETDIHFTSDGEIVCIHNDTVDATSNGTGNVASMTLAQLKALDFGSWFSSKYAGTTIPTLAETLTLARGLGLGVYIEIKPTLDATKAAAVVNTVRNCGMNGRVNYISFNLASLQAIAAIDHESRIGLLVNTPSQTDIDNVLAIHSTHGNSVFIDMSATSDTAYNLCLTNGVDVENWTINNATQIAETIRPIVKGFTSDFRVAGKYLYLANR